MKTYEVTLIETLEKKVIVKAESISEARFIADKNYHATDDEYILSADNSTVFFEIGDVEEIDGKN